LSTESIAKAFVLLVLSAALAVMVSVASATEAHAQDMSAELEEFNSECFDSVSGEFLGTDGCFEWAEEHIELENLLESIEKGCTLTDMYEDYSCKGPQGPSSPSSSNSSGEASEQGTQISEQSTTTEDVKGCFVVPADDPQVREQEIAALQSLGFHGDPSDSAEQLYSPDCFNAMPVSELDSRLVEQLRLDPCYDVVSDTADMSAAHVEYVGCPSQGSQDTPDDEAYTPITQQGTYAPADWKAHVVPLKPATSHEPATSTSKGSSTKEARTFMLSNTNPYQEHRDNDNGRSQGQVVSEEHREKAHAAATKVQSKLKASEAEKAKKASSSEASKKR